MVYKEAQLRVPSPRKSDWRCAMRLIRQFSPSWFSVNMGVGVTGNLLMLAPYKLTGMETAAAILYVVNTILFLLFSGLTCARYVLYPETLKKLLQQPMQCMFVGTLPMGFATIITSTVLIAVPRNSASWLLQLVWALWWFDSVLSLLCSVAIPALMFHAHTLSLSSMTAAWMLPVVPPIVAAATGAVVAAVLSPAQALYTILVCYAQLAIGMGLSLIIMVVYFHRLTVHKLPAADVIVSGFLPVGPFGMVAYALIRLAQVGRTAFTSDHFEGVANAAEMVYVGSVIAGFLLWSFGLWWLLHAVISVLVRCASDGLHFNMGHWAFVFPLGVYTLATIVLATALAAPFLAYLSMVFIAALVLLTAAVSCKTVLSITRGALLLAPDLSSTSFHFDIDQGTAAAVAART